MLCRIIVQVHLKSLGRPRVRYLVLMSEFNYGLDFFALTERLHDRLNRQAFPFPASINSMNSESVCIIVPILDRPQTSLASIYKPPSGWTAEAFFLLLKVEIRRWFQKQVIVTQRLLCIRSNIRSL